MCFCLDLPKDLNANTTPAKLGWTLVAAFPSGFFVVVASGFWGVLGFLGWLLWVFCFVPPPPSILMKFITIAFKLRLWFKFSKAGRAGLKAWRIRVYVLPEEQGSLQNLPQGVPGWSPHPLDIFAITQATGFLASLAGLLLTAKQPHIQACQYFPWRYLQFTF